MSKYEFLRLLILHKKLYAMDTLSTRIESEDTGPVLAICRPLELSHASVLFDAGKYFHFNLLCTPIQSNIPRLSRHQRQDVKDMGILL